MNTCDGVFKSYFPMLHVEKEGRVQHYTRNLGLSWFSAVEPYALGNDSGRS